MKWFVTNRAGQLIAFIIGVIAIPNLIEEYVSILFDVNFENDVWYEVLDTFIMLLVGIPFMWWMLGKMDRYMREREELLNERRKITDELIKSHEELFRMAYFDQLTGLPNRERMVLDLQKLMEETTQPSAEGTVVVALMDLDRFQQVNDILGHAAGERILQAAATRLLDSLPGNCTVYRYMACKFGIVALANDAPPSIFVERRVFPRILAEPIQVDQEEIYLTASCGISSYAHHGDTADVLLQHADQALSKAKRKGGNQIHVFDPELADIAKRKLKLETGLQKATGDGSLSLHYQPQVELSSGRIVGVEALLRWSHPELGLISPLEFIPLAEETGAIHLIGRWVVETACQQMHNWRTSGIGPFTMAVNVSPLQLKRTDFCNFLAAELARNHIPAELFEVEVTESIMQDLVSSQRIFCDLASIGVKIAIDDFGTGYSSLSVLGTLSIDCLKIDQSFVRQMDSNPKMRSTVKTIIQLGRNHGVELIAEGIEEPHRAEELAEYGCCYGQGYWFSRPVPASEISEMIKAEGSVVR